MTLGDFAMLVGGTPKWVQNAIAALGIDLAYTVRNAQRLAVAKALADGVGMPLTRAYALAGEVLHQYDGSPGPVQVPVPGAATGLVVASIDVYRILAAVNVRIARLRTTHAPRRRGRPAASRDALRVATDYGLDLTLLAANLRRAPAERLRQLDGMVSFRQRVRRG